MHEGPSERPAPPELIAAAIAHGSAERASYRGLDHVRFRDDFQGVGRGSTLVAGRLVPSYPPIGRIFALERGLRRHFPGPFRAEEKVDGYNVRIARLDGRLVPFTRGGFVCPFTEDRLADLGDFAPLLAAHPDLVLCGEVAGPHNPYIDSPSPHAPSDVRFFAFDLMRLDRAGVVEVTERDRLLEAYRVPTAPQLGRHRASDLDRIRELVLAVDARGGEGVVFKAEGQPTRVKYAAPSINAADLLADARLLAELPPEFFLTRLLRLALAVDELGLGERAAELERRLGRALLGDFLPTVLRVRQGGKVTRVHVVRLHSDEAADRLLEHLGRASRTVQVREIGRQWDGEWRLVTVEKTFQGSTSRLRTLLDGHAVVD